MWYQHILFKKTNTKSRSGFFKSASKAFCKKSHSPRVCNCQVMTKREGYYKLFQFLLRISYNCQKMTFWSNNYKFANETPQVFFGFFFNSKNKLSFVSFYYQLVYTKHVAGSFLLGIKIGFKTLHEFCSWLTKW